MGSVKNQMMMERDLFWIDLHRKIKNSDSLEDFLESAQELYYLCESSEALYENITYNRYNLKNSTPLLNGIYQNLLKESYYIYYEERNKREN